MKRDLGLRDSNYVFILNYTYMMELGIDLKNPKAADEKYILSSDDDDVKTSDYKNNLMKNYENLPSDFNLITLTSNDIKSVELQLTDFINQTGKFCP